MGELGAAGADVAPPPFPMHGLEGRSLKAAPFPFVLTVNLAPRRLATHFRQGGITPCGFVRPSSSGSRFPWYDRSSPEWFNGSPSRLLKKSVAAQARLW